jgi:5-formyltetrahydrofolate cyclo-ligase
VPTTDSRGPRGKAATRRSLIAIRDGMPAAARAAASARICDAAAAVIAARRAAVGVVAVYAAKDSEVDVARLDGGLRARGARVAYPRVVRGDRVLRFHEVERDGLAAAGFGLAEPSADAPAVRLEEISVFVAPGLAFDRAGRRLGWGRGHYDATFAAAPGALRIGVGYGCQLIDEVPHEAHDVGLHVIITEDATLVVA